MNTEAIAIGPLEVWGGVECTVNRVGDEYFDQLERSGHATRLEDLDLFAEPVSYTHLTLPTNREV